MKTDKLISLLTDYGFKVSFGTENTLFLRTALALLIKSPIKLKQVNQMRNEFESYVPDRRAGIYDVLCQDGKGTRYIIEMQVGNYDRLIERMLFYLTYLFATQATKGKKGFIKMKPVFCICISTDNIFPESETFYNHFEFKNEDGSLVLPHLHFILVELNKFHKTRNQLENELDELLYTMKHAHKIEKDQQPRFWRKKWLEETIKKIDFSSMTAEEKVIYDMMLIRNQILIEHDEKKDKELAKKVKKQAKEEGLREGIEQGMEKGMEKGMKKGMEKGMEILEKAKISAIQKSLKKGILLKKLLIFKTLQ